MTNLSCHRLSGESDTIHKYNYKSKHISAVGSADSGPYGGRQSRQDSPFSVWVSFKREFIAIPNFKIDHHMGLSLTFLLLVVINILIVQRGRRRASHHKDTTSVANLLFCLFFVVYNLFYLSVETQHKHCHHTLLIKVVKTKQKY